MTTWTRKFSVIALAAGLAFGTAACDDDDNVGPRPGNSTSTTVSTTSTSSTSTTSVSTTSTSSTTSSSTTSVTTGSTTTTSTTMGGGIPACECNVTWAITSADTLGSLQYDTDYSAAMGTFKGSGAAVECTALAGDFTAFNNIEASQKLSTATISTAGFTGPTDVSECTFLTDNPALAPGDFGLTITDQSAPDFTPTNATMEINAVNCVCDSTTTTLGGSTTTTTVGGTTTTTVGGTTTTTVGGTTTTTVGGTTTTTMGGSGTIWAIEMNLDDSVVLGALQFAVDYSAAGGDFVGTAGAVQCTSPLGAGGAFVTFNDEDATTTLNMAAVALSGFTGPTIVANCNFDAALMPAPADFVITVIDASDPGLAPIVPLPVVSISNITLAP